MSKLYKFLVILLIMIASGQAYSQTFILRIGANFSSQSIKDNDLNYSKEDYFKMLPGGNLGFFVDIPVYESFSVETGLMLNTKGYKVKESDNTTKYVEYNYLGYIDLPINAKYTLDLRGPKLYVTAGPYFAYGFFGKQFTKTTTNGQLTTSEMDYEWGSGEDDFYKNLDIGLNFGGGFQFGSFVIGANYGLGLRNISSITENGMSMKNRVLSVSIGANFGK